MTPEPGDDPRRSDALDADDPATRDLDWQRVEEVFHRLAQASPEERRARAEAECGDDPAVLAEVRALLDASAAGRAVDDSIRDVVRDWAAQDGAAQDGAAPNRGGNVRATPDDPEQIGPFRVLRRLGEGGLAVVYLAERREPYRQQVAIKLLKRGLETEEILHRLKVEGQILARLEHPNVARIFDGGWTDDGRPYFVLEYVDGEPIDGYCDRRRLGVAERLRLFHRVCRAVQQAHARLVVHRDLKPSNLLVTDDGTPKLLDFGIAKLLDASRVGVTAAHTRPGVQWMTLDYAAPEQVTGETLTTAVDVYALGVLLYELLCGELPRRLSAEPLTRVAQALRRAPEPPSARITDETSARRSASADGLRRTLRGDLDTIVGKALRFEPERRYASVQALADDVQRYLDQQPVRARPDTWSYRTGKFVRRHRLGVASALGVFMALVVALLVTAQALRSAESQRRLAEQRLEEVEAVIDFTTGMFEIADPGEARGNAVTVREILDRGAARVEREMVGRPAIAARLMGTMGQVYRNLGLYPSARQLLAEAAERWRLAAGDDSPEALESRRELAAVLLDEGRFDEAAAELEAIRRAEAEHYGPGDPALASTLQLSALLARETAAQGADADAGPDAGAGEDRAETWLRQALALRLEAHGDRHLDVAESLNELGQLMLERTPPDLDEASELFTRALAVRQDLLGPDHPLVAEALHNLATVDERRGRLQEADAGLRRVLRIRRQVLGARHRDVAVTLNNLAGVQCAEGLHGEALRSLREALDIAREVIPDHPHTARILNNLALELKDVGRLDEAVDAMAEALALKVELFGAVSENVVRNQFNHALLLAEAGRRDEAVRGLEENLRTMAELGLEGPRAYPLTLLAELRAQDGRCDLSAPLAEEAFERRSHLPPEHELRRRTEEVRRLCDEP